MNEVFEADRRNMSEEFEFNKVLKNKTVVVDTSSLLLSGVGLIQSLPPCTIVVPSLVVKELEQKRNSTVGFLAREWLRLIEDLRAKYGEKLGSGVPIPGCDQIFMKIEPNRQTLHKNFPKYLRKEIPDNSTLAVALYLQQMSQNPIVILSNDSTMRLHATLDFGIDAIEFSPSRLMQYDPYSGIEEITITQEEYVEIAQNSEKISEIILPYVEKFDAMNFVVFVFLPDDSTPVLQLMVRDGKIIPVKRKFRAKNIVGKNIEQDIAMKYLFEDPDSLPVVSISGGAGTGKTIISLASGIDLVERGEYQKVIVFRSLHEMGKGQELGFLPGDLNEKMSAWSGAVTDALDVISSKNGIALENKKSLQSLIEVQPITFLRGRNLSNSFVILDEAQNFSRNELLNILSRAGVGTKMVLCFDASQVDNKYLLSGKYAEVWSVVESLKNTGISAHINLMKTERSKVAAIAASLLEL